MAAIDQSSTGTNASISASRSTISRTATDYLRPALRLRFTLPEKRAQVVADKPVHHTARLLRVHAVPSSVRGLQRLAHRLRVISLNSMRSGFSSRKASSRCQAIASPRGRGVRGQ